MFLKQTLYTLSKRTYTCMADKIIQRKSDLELMKML